MRYYYPFTRLTAARFIAAFENDLDIDYTCRRSFPNPLAPCATTDGTVDDVSHAFSSVRAAVN